MSAATRPPKRYAICDWLPLEARRAAVESQYRNLRTLDDCCPLEVALLEMWRMGLIPHPPGAITNERHVASALAEPDTLEWLRIRDAAGEFIRPWDGRKIPYKALATALGVED